MKAKKLPAFAFFLSLGASAWAADAIEAGSPIYKSLFENDRVRVMIAHFKPGEKVPMHTHPDQILYVIQGGAMKETFANQIYRQVLRDTGKVEWQRAETLEEENAGTEDYKALIVELKNPPR